MPKVSLVLTESTGIPKNQRYEIPLIFLIESDYNHGVEDDTLLSAIKHNKEISLSSHISRLEAEWNPDFNHRFIASFSGDAGDRHCGTRGIYKRITAIEGLRDSIENSYMVNLFEFESFKVKFGGAEKTFSSNDLLLFLVSILIENENVDITHNDSEIRREDNTYVSITSSTSFFDVEMDYHYQRLKIVNGSGVGL